MDLAKSPFRRRDNSVRESWRGVNERMVVNDTQHSFSSPEKERAFFEGQVNTPQDKARYKIYREEWFRRAKEFDPGPQPLSVVIELVSTCNLGCSMCYTITEEFQNSVIGAQRSMPWPVVRNVIDECAELDVPSLLFSWRGESTLYRQRDEGGGEVSFANVLSYARRAGILEITCLTNGQTIDEDMARGIVAAEPNWISISIDGLEPAYNRIRRPRKATPVESPFLTLFDNIRRLVRLRDEAGKTRPKIRSNAVYPSIASDPEGYRDFFEGVGVDWVTVNELLDFRGENMPDECVKDDWACQYPFQRIAISSNGIVLPCTGAHNEEEHLVLGRYIGTPPKVVRRADGSKAMIDVPETTIREAWTGEKLENIRRMHMENRRKEIAPGCRNCRHGAVKHGVTWIPDEWNMETMEWEGREWRE